MRWPNRGKKNPKFKKRIGGKKKKRGQQDLQFKKQPTIIKVLKDIKIHVIRIFIEIGE